MLNPCEMMPDEIQAEIEELKDCTDEDSKHRLNELKEEIGIQDDLFKEMKLT